MNKEEFIKKFLIEHPKFSYDNPIENVFKVNPNKLILKKSEMTWRDFRVKDEFYNEWNNLKKLYSEKCLCCGKSEPEIKLTVDHVIPLSKDGDFESHNWQLLCFDCNRKKGRQIIDYR